MLSKRNLPLAVLLLMVCLVYANSFSNGFHFDDFHTVTDNPAVRSLRNLPEIFTDATKFSVAPTNQTYRPVVTASLALDYALGHGYNVFWFHLSTLVWFLVLIALIYFFFELLLNTVQKGPANRWLALSVAAWFGLHPAMAETVNYIVQRGDVYCTLGCVAALFIFARWPKLRGSWIYLLPFVVAMLSKPPAAVFPVLLLLYVFFFESSGESVRRRWSVSARAAVPAVGTAAVLLFLQAAMTPKTFTPGIVSAAGYRMTQPFVWLRYVGTLFLPIHLNVDTDLGAFLKLNGEAVLGIAFILCLFALIAYTARRRRLYPIAFGLAWFVVTQLPTSLYALSEVENDHRMFFSFPGLMLAVVWSFYLLYERLRVRELWLRPVIMGVAVCSLCGYAYGAHRRNAVWHTEDTLWADDVAKSPHNGRGLMIYGLTKMNAGDLQGALALFKRALIYAPNYSTLEVNLGVLNGLLAARGDAGRAATAENHFRRALALAQGEDTTHAYYGRWLLTQGRLDQAVAQIQTAVTLSGQRLMNRDLLIQAYTQQGNVAEAKKVAQETLRIAPNDAAALATRNGSAAAGSGAEAHINASLAAYRMGQFQLAIDEAKAALALDPNSAAAWNNVGAAYGALHRWDAAIDAEQRAAKLDPGLDVARNNLRSFVAYRVVAEGSHAPLEAKSAADWIDLSLALNRAGRYVDSLAAARKALALDPDSPEAWNNVAANDEALHQWDEAIAAAQKAVILKPDFQLARNNLAWSIQQRELAAKH